jgi:hypothetical protein
VKFWVKGGSDEIVKLFKVFHASLAVDNPPINPVQLLVEHPILPLFDDYMKLPMFSIEGKCTRIDDIILVPSY